LYKHFTIFALYAFLRGEERCEARVSQSSPRLVM